MWSQPFPEPQWLSRTAATFILGVPLRPGEVAAVFAEPITSLVEACWQSQCATLGCGVVRQVSGAPPDGTIDEERVFIRASDQYLNDKTDQISPLQRSHSNDP